MEKKPSNDASRSRVEASSSGQEDQDHSLNGHAESAPDPSDALPAVDEDQLSVLQRVGDEWGRVSSDPQVWRRALPVDPNVGSYPASTDIQPTRLGRFVRVSLRTGAPPEVEATSAAEVPSSLLDRLGEEEGHATPTATTGQHITKERSPSGRPSQPWSQSSQEPHPTVEGERSWASSRTVMAGCAASCCSI